MLPRMGEFSGVFSDAVRFPNFFRSVFRFDVWRRQPFASVPFSPKIFSFPLLVIIPAFPPLGTHTFSYSDSAHTPPVNLRGSLPFFPLPCRTPSTHPILTRNPCLPPDTSSRRSLNLLCTAFFFILSKHLAPSLREKKSPVVPVPYFLIKVYDSSLLLLRLSLSLPTQDLGPPGHPLC